MFVVADQAPVQYQDPVGLLDPPPLRLRNESRLLRVALDDLDVDAEMIAVRDDLVLEALVDQGPRDGSPGVFGDLVQQGDAALALERAAGQQQRFAKIDTLAVRVLATALAGRPVATIVPGSRPIWW